MTIKRLWLSIVILIVGPAYGGVSGNLEMLTERDDRLFQNKSRNEQHLNLAYQDPELELRGALSLSLSQREDQNENSLSQLYLEKHLNKRRSLLKLGRMQRSDASGFYILDGLMLKQSNNTTGLTLYAGKPSRIDYFRSIEGKAIYGVDLRATLSRFDHYKVDSNIGWQRLEPSNSLGRINIHSRGVYSQSANSVTSRHETPPLFSPSAFAFSGSYLLEENHWESIQLSAYRDIALQEETSMRFRAHYEIFTPNEEVITFKDRFYSLYARGYQSQFKAGFQVHSQHTPTYAISGYKVVNKWGDNGYGMSANFEYRGTKGWQCKTQVDRLMLPSEYMNSLYLETRKTLTSMLRGNLSVVLQQQHKRLTGDNQSKGLEARLERRVKFKTLPNALWFAAEGYYIQNTRLNNETRLSLRLNYPFDSRSRGSL